MKKELFIENSPFLTRMVIPDDLKESIQIKQSSNNTLIVKNVPATILNRGNQNGRIYSTEEMQKAIDAAKQQIETKQLLCQASEHPEGSFVSPTHASHVIINAYIKKNVKLEVEGEKGRWDVLFCDIEVLNTQEGQNLQALLLSGCSVGTSIRGLGDMQGDKVVNYEFLGFDIVSNPSSGTFTNMPIYEAKIESVDERQLDEATRYTISTYASNTTHDLQQAIDFQNNAATNLTYGTITNVGTKMDQEVDPDTGVEKIVGEVEVETSDDTSELKTAIDAAVKAFTNPNNINVTSITIEKVDDDDIKDSTEDAADDTLTETDSIEVNNNKVITNIDGEEYEKEFKDKDQAKIAASGVEHGNLEPSTILPDPDKNSTSDQSDTLLDDSVQEDANDSDEESEMRQAVLDALAKGDNKMALAFAKAMQNKQPAQSQKGTAPVDNEADLDIAQNNASFATDNLQNTDTKNIDNNNTDLNTSEPAIIDSVDNESDNTAENLYKEPTPASDELVEPEKQTFSDDADNSQKQQDANDLLDDYLEDPADISDSVQDSNQNTESEEVFVELSDISYDVEKDSELTEDDGEYDSILSALEQLPDTITIKISGSEINPDQDPMEILLKKAKEQTGLPIKNARILDVQDA